VRLTAGGKTESRTLDIVKDPRTPATAEDFDKQFTLLMQIHDRLTETHDAIAAIIDARSQLQAAVARAARTPAAGTIADRAKALDASLAAVQDELVQMKLKEGNDVLTYPARLNNLFASLASTVAATDIAPTRQSYDVFNDLSARLARLLAKLDEIVDRDVAAFNKAMADGHVPAVTLRPRPK
jgi:flagellar hook-associated protein FlgK